VPVVALPVTANGKLDKSALPAPSADNVLPSGIPAAAVNGAAAPHGSSNGCLQQVASLVASLLGQPTVEPEENFFMIGGHSMLGVELVARIKDQFGVKLTLRQLFTAPTVAALAAEVARQMSLKG
jgi:acyl carrier protein